MALRLSPHMTVMANAAQKAAKRLLRDFAEVEQLQVSVKGPSDFVSQADIRAEQTLKEELNKARPGYAFLMEESGASGSDNWAWRWVVDPLDGTTNFLHGMPHWAISIGLERRLPDGTLGARRRPGLCPGRRRDVLGRKRRRRLRQRAAAARLGAARDERGGVRHRHPVRRGVAGAAQRVQPHAGALMPQVAGIRRFGAAALDLAWVAAGRFDGYWELGIKRWDIAAGLLLVREAGGYATDVGDGDPRQTSDIVAGQPASACEVADDRRRRHAAFGLATAIRRMIRKSDVSRCSDARY